MLRKNARKTHEKEGGRKALNPQKQVLAEPCRPTFKCRSSALHSILGCIAKLRKKGDTKLRFLPQRLCFLINYQKLWVLNQKSKERKALRASQHERLTKKDAKV